MWTISPAVPSPPHAALMAPCWAAALELSTMPTAEWSVGTSQDFLESEAGRTSQASCPEREGIAESQAPPHSPQCLIQKASPGQSSTVCLGFSSCQHSSPTMREILSLAQNVLFSHKTMNSYGVKDAGFSKCHLMRHSSDTKWVSFYEA